MDTSAALAIDQHAGYQRRGNNSFHHTPQPSPGQSMTFQQQQQLLKLLNAHVGGGAGAGTGLSFYGAHGNGNMKQVPKHQQQHIPPHSNAPPPVLVHLPPTNAHLPPRPAYSSLPAPHLVRQQSNPPLLPLPFNRSSSLPVPGPVRPPRNNKPAQSAAPAPRANFGAKEQQKITRPGKVAPSTGSQPVVAKPKKIEPSIEAPVKLDVSKQPIVPPVDRKKPDAAPAAAMDRKLCDVYKAEIQQQGTVTDRSTAFSVYSLAPHPSSLPLPRLISLRPKAVPVAASCNAEAVMIGGTDAFDQGPGMSNDDLRRLLRL